jgi:hypothetical protein
VLLARRHPAHRTMRLSAIEEKLSGHAACFFCLGVSSVEEEAYQRVAYDLTISVATTLANPR